MRCDVGFWKLVATGILAAGLASACASSSVPGSGSPAAEQKSASATHHPAPSRSPAHRPPARTSPAPTRSAPTRSAPTRSAPTRSVPTPPPTAPAPAAPADGRNLAACRDVSCQVELVTGDHIALDPALGLDEMAVTSVGSLISFRLSGHGDGLNLVGRDVSTGATCTDGACTTTGSLSLTAGMTGRINSIHLTLTALAGERAVVTMRPS